MTVICIRGASLFGAFTIGFGLLFSAAHAENAYGVKNAFNSVVDVCSDENIPLSTRHAELAKRGWRPAKDGETDQGARLLAHVESINTYIDSKGQPVPEGYTEGQVAFWLEDHEKGRNAASQPVWFFTDDTEDALLVLLPYSVDGTVSLIHRCAVYARSSADEPLLDMKRIERAQSDKLPKLDFEETAVFDVFSNKTESASDAYLLASENSVVAVPIDRNLAGQYFGSDAIIYTWSITTVPSL